MRIHVVGGGPGGLLAAVLLKKADPSRPVRVFERNRPDDTFGFGVVFSDAALEEVRSADPETHQAMAEAFHHWDDIHVHYRGRRMESTGHGFAGLSRRTLLGVLHRRCHELGVDLHFETEVGEADPSRTDASPPSSAHHHSGPAVPSGASLPSGADLWDADLVIAADGAGSALRQRFARTFQPEADLRPNRFVWLGVARPFPAFTFHFKESRHGLWRVHAYQYDAAGASTFIVEATDDTWRRAGMDKAAEPETIRFLSHLFREELDGSPLVGNRSMWRRFPTVRCARWWASAEVDEQAVAEGADADEPVHPPSPLVLLGDAAHTAHFSVGSGTRLAMQDAIALANAMDTPDALAAYEAERRPAVESLQRAAQASLQWFEDTERYMDMAPVQFAFSLLTRSLRISHENLRERDRAFVAEVDRWVAAQAEVQTGVPCVPHAARDPVPLTAPAPVPAPEPRPEPTPPPKPAPASVSAPPAVPAPTTPPPPPPLFTPFRLRELVLPNRVGVSAMCQYLAEDGTPNDWHLVHLGSRAVGGAGLVVAEMTAVSRDARISPGCAGLYRNEHVAAWRRVVRFVHGNTQAKVGIQLGHAGRKGSTRIHWEGADEPLEAGGWPIVSASPLGYFPHSPVPQALDAAAMDAVAADFQRAAKMALEAGFDLIEVHMAHGYLLASFLSPLTNQRTDDYGGSLANRLRFPLRVVSAVRAVWPDEKPLTARISAVDWAPGGNEPEDAVEIAKALKSVGCDAVDVSAGQTVPYQQPKYGRQFQTPFADRIRHEAGVATMAVGNISSFEDVNGIVAAGRADLCLMARAHLWNPYWTRHAAYALGHPVPWPDPYHQALDGFTPRLGIGPEGKPSAGASDR